MCWSIEASAVLAITGLGTSVVARARGDQPAIWATLGYFSLMEGLQAVTYLVIDACGAPANAILTVLAYVHIAFQPLFINLISLSFIPQHARRRVAPIVYSLCVGSGLFMLLQLYPFTWSPNCGIGQTLCGTQLCAVTGTWHIGWEVPYRTFGLFVAFPTYLLMAFIAPVVYGSWKFTLFHVITGPAAAYLSTRNPNEWPAVWCLYSVGLVLVAMIRPMRRWFVVTNWVWRADRDVSPATGRPGGYGFDGAPSYDNGGERY
jgi:hypothetical protein